jgi:GTPase SAR1 family protein
MKLALCGGTGVGKTSILRRLAGGVFKESHEPTYGINKAAFKLGESLQDVQIWDIGADLLTSSYFAHQIFLADIDAAIFVVDAGSLKSLQDVDNWMGLLANFSWTSQIPKFLLVHKADCEEKVVNAEDLDTFVHSSGCLDWAFTVGSEEYCDFDPSRDHSRKQSSPIDVVRRIIASAAIIAGNDSLFPTPNPQLTLSSMSVVDLSAYSAGITQNPMKTSLRYPDYCIKLRYDDNFCKRPTDEILTMISSEKFEDEGWSYFCGRLSRSVAETVLLGFPNGTFLIRQSDVNSDCRIVVKESRYSIKHIEFKWTVGFKMYKCGRSDVRRLDFETLSDILSRLDLNRQLGIVPESLPGLTNLLKTKEN